MADRPRYPIPREEPDSDRPERDERPFRRPATAFVTRAEVEQMITEAMREVLGPIRRVEAMARESRDELREAKRERELRAQWDREQRERDQLEAVRERSKSEQDLAQALQRPATPMQFLPVSIPKAPDSEPSTSKHRLNRTQVIVAVISAIALVAATAIGAIYSQHTSPHGVIEAPSEHH